MRFEFWEALKTVFLRIFTHLYSVSSQRNNQIKIAHYHETKKRAHDLQIVIAKVNLNYSCSGPRQRQASGTNQRIKVLRQGHH